MTETPNLVLAVSLIFVFGLALLAVITVTSFVKISVVLFLLRTALGIQQSPPNVVLYAIAFILTVFISAPLGRAVYDNVAATGVDVHSFADVRTVLTEAEKPVREHLLAFTVPRERAFFLQAAQRLWPPDMRDVAGPDSIPVLLPSYLVGELKRSFEIGFLIYLPFVTIDLVVTTILVAMGMSQVQPSTISVPFKLLLFVLASGWTRLLHGLVISYVT